MAGSAVHSAGGLGGDSSLAGAGATCTQENTFGLSFDCRKRVYFIGIVHAPDPSELLSSARIHVGLSSPGCCLKAIQVLCEQLQA